MAVALLAVIGVTVAVTLWVTRDDDQQTAGPSTSPTGASSDTASANDTGPVNIITEDPTCGSAKAILETRSGQLRNGWDSRDPSIPASSWTPAMRAQFEAAAQTMRNAAGQMVALVRLTPHRVMRELYEQFIAYSRAYADSIPTYTPRDENLALVTTTASDAITRICAAITYGSASARGPLVPSPATPSQISPLGNPAEPERFITEPNAVCTEWAEAWAQFQKDTAAWASTNPNIPAGQWTPEQRAINDAVAPVMGAFANELQAMGDRSGNPTFQDFATLSAQYRRAYVESLPSYVTSDTYLSNASLKLGGVVEAACQAVSSR